MVLAAAALVYFGRVAGMIALRPLELAALPFALVLWPLLICLPALTVMALTWVIVGRPWLAIAISLIAIPAFLTQFQPAPEYRIEQASARPQGHDAIIVTSKEKPMLTYYCFVMPVIIANSRVQGWHLIATSFDVYLLHTIPALDLKKVTTISFGTNDASRDYGHYNYDLTGRKYLRAKEYAVDINGWTDDGKAFLSEIILGDPNGKRYAVDAISGSILEASSLPSNIMLDYPTFSKWCIVVRAEGNAVYRDHIALATQGLSVDLLTDQDKVWRRNLYYVNQEGELVPNPAYTASPERELCCSGKDMPKRICRGDFNRC